MEADDLLCSHNARSRKDGRGAARPSFLLAEAARSECAPLMRAVKDSLADPLRQSGENRKALARANGTSRRASGWAGEEVARSGRSISPPSLERKRASFEGSFVASLDGRAETSAGPILRER